MDISQSSKAKSSKPKLGPYQEGVSKALKASGEQQASEALMQGVPPQHIEQQAGLVDPKMLEQLMQLAETKVQTKSDGSLLGNKTGILPAILATLTGNPTSPFAPKTEALGLSNAIQLAGVQQSVNKSGMEAQKFPLEMEKLQNESAQAPLQTQKLKQEVDPAFQDRKLARQESIKSKYEATKEERAQLNEFRTKVIRPPTMSGSDSKIYNIQKQGLQALMTIEQVLNSNPEQLQELNVPGNKLGQQLASATNIFANAALRDESGGVITKDEIKSFKKDLSPVTGFRAALTDPDAQKLRVQSFKQRLQGAIKGIDPFVDVREKYHQAKKAGHSDEEIFGFMREKGLA